MAEQSDLKRVYQCNGVTSIRRKDHVLFRVYRDMDTDTAEIEIDRACEVETPQVDCMLPLPFADVVDEAGKICFGKITAHIVKEIGDPLPFPPRDDLDSSGRPIARRPPTEME